MKKMGINYPPLKEVVLAPQFIFFSIVFLTMYTVLFEFIGRSVAALNLVFLLYFSTLYGRKGGVIAGILNLPFNLVAFYMVGGVAAFADIGAPFWSSSLGLICVCYYIGNTQELKQKIASELDHSQHITEQLKKEKERVLQASIDKDKLLMSISHDLRTPLSAIMQSAELINIQPEQSKQRIASIVNSGQQLLDIINDLLGSYKQQYGDIVAASKSFSIQQHLLEIQALFEPLFRQKRLTLEVNIETNTPKCIQGYPKFLRQVLFNLLSNSLKHTDVGGVTINVSVVMATNSLDDVLHITVIDTGSGISTENLAVLLAKAEQRSVPNIQSGKSGYGLGLGNCLNMARRMNGHIIFQANKPNGLQVILKLPLIKGSQAESIPMDMLKNAKKVMATSGINVLIVEDDQANAETLQAMFQYLSCSVEVVASGQLAIEAVASTSFDLIIQDYQLPDMSGTELMPMLRSANRSNNERLVIVFLSANILLADFQKWITLDVDLVLSKPINLAELQNICSYTLEKPVQKNNEMLESLYDDKMIKQYEQLMGISAIEKNLELLSQYLDQCLFASGCQDYLSCAQIIHKFASAAGILGFKYLVSQARVLENYAHKQDRIQCFIILRDLTYCYQQVKQQLLLIYRF